MKKFDAFISHASEDKRYFVKPLAQKMANYGSRIWFDEFSLKPGVSLSRSIELGLSKSKFGIVILSEAFFRKNWTGYELKALNAYEVQNPGIIIPVWYKVNLKSVRKFSPYLSDKLAIIYDKKSIDDIAIEILEVIREDIFEEVLKRKAWNEELKKGIISKMSVEEAKGKIKIGPIRHKSLPPDLIIRIRSIRISLFEVYMHSMEYWVEGFQRDMHPEEEVHSWERIASAYSECIIFLKLHSLDKRKEAFALILGVVSGNDIKDMKLEFLSSKEIKMIVNASRSLTPIFDIKDEKFGDTWPNRL